MAYKKTNWVDNETPISAENLNKMEDGIVEASKTGGVLDGSIIEWEEDTIPEGYEEVEGNNFVKLFEGNAKLGDTIELLEDYRKFTFLHIETGSDAVYFNGALIGSTLNEYCIDASKLWGNGSTIFQLHSLRLDIVDPTHFTIGEARYMNLATSAITEFKVKEIWGSL